MKRKLKKNLICADCNKQILDNCFDIFRNKDIGKDEYLCHECSDKNYNYCSECGELVHKEIITFVESRLVGSIEKEPICYDCVKKYDSCNKCGKILVDYIEKVQDEYEDWYCLDCAKKDKGVIQCM